MGTEAIPDLRCYVCGEPLGVDFVVFSMSRPVDRVFVMHQGTCTQRIEYAEANVIIPVKRSKR